MFGTIEHPPTSANANECLMILKRKFPRPQSNDLNNLILSKDFQGKRPTLTQHHIFKQAKKKKFQSLENILQRTTSVTIPALEFLSCCPALPNKFIQGQMILQGLRFCRITKRAHRIKYSTDSQSPLAANEHPSLSPKADIC